MREAACSSFCSVSSFRSSMWEVWVIFALFTTVILTLTEPSDGESISSELLNVSFAESELYFHVSFLNNSQDVGNYMTWRYVKFKEIGSTAFCPPELGGCKPDNINVLDTVLSTIFEEDFIRVDQNATLTGEGRRDVVIVENCVTTTNLLLNKNKTFEFANETHDVSQGGLKFYLGIDKWPWESVDGYAIAVTVTLTLNASDLISDFEFITSPNTSKLEQLLIKGSTQTWVVKFAQNYLANNVAYPVGGLEVDPGPCLNTNNCELTFVIEFPRCPDTIGDNCTIVYDPDISALFHSNNPSSSGGSGGSDDDDNTELITILVAVIVPVVVLVVIMAIGIALFASLVAIVRMKLLPVNDFKEVNF